LKENLDKLCGRSDIENEDTKQVETEVRNPEALLAVIRLFTLKYIVVLQGRLRRDGAIIKWNYELWDIRWTITS
jgi:hypothetical protein